MSSKKIIAKTILSAVFYIIFAFFSCNNIKMGNISSIVPLVHINEANASETAVPSTIKSIDILYEININSKIDVTEKIAFDGNVTGELEYKISKYYKSDNNELDYLDTNYIIKDIKVYQGESEKIQYKTEEDNKEIKLFIDISNLKENQKYITLKYTIENAIKKVEKKDNENVRNNVELLGNLILLGGGEINNIKSLTAKVESKYADIGSVECYAGDLNAGQRLCLSEFDKNEARFYSTGLLGEGNGFLASFKMKKGGSIEAPGKVGGFLNQVINFLRVNAVAIILTIVVVILFIYIWKKVFYIKKI